MELKKLKEAIDITLNPEARESKGKHGGTITKYGSLSVVSMKTLVSVAKKWMKECIKKIDGEPDEFECGMTTGFDHLAKTVGVPVRNLVIFADTTEQDVSSLMDHNGFLYSATDDSNLYYFKMGDKVMELVINRGLDIGDKVYSISFGFYSEGYDGGDRSLAFKALGRISQIIAIFDKQHPGAMYNFSGTSLSRDLVYMRMLQKASKQREIYFYRIVREEKDYSTGKKILEKDSLLFSMNATPPDNDSYIGERIVRIDPKREMARIKKESSKDATKRRMNNIIKQAMGGSDPKGVYIHEAIDQLHMGRIFNAIYGKRVSEEDYDYEEIVYKVLRNFNNKYPNEFNIGYNDDIDDLINSGYIKEFAAACIKMAKKEGMIVEAFEKARKIQKRKGTSFTYKDVYHICKNIPFIHTTSKDRIVKILKDQKLLSADQLDYGDAESDDEDYDMTPANTYYLDRYFKTSANVFLSYAKEETAYGGDLSFLIHPKQAAKLGYVQWEDIAATWDKLADRYNTRYGQGEEGFDDWAGEYYDEMGEYPQVMDFGETEMDAQFPPELADDVESMIMKKRYTIREFIMLISYLIFRFAANKKILDVNDAVNRFFSIFSKVRPELHIEHYVSVDEDVDLILYRRTGSKLSQKNIEITGLLKKTGKSVKIGKDRLKPMDFYNVFKNKKSIAETLRLRGSPVDTSGTRYKNFKLIAADKLGTDEMNDDTIIYTDEGGDTNFWFMLKGDTYEVNINSFDDRLYDMSFDVLDGSGGDTGKNMAIQVFRMVAMTADIFLQWHPNTLVQFTGARSSKDVSQGKNRRYNVYAKMLERTDVDLHAYMTDDGETLYFAKSPDIDLEDSVKKGFAKKLKGRSSKESQLTEGIKSGWFIHAGHKGDLKSLKVQPVKDESFPKPMGGLWLCESTEWSKWTASANFEQMRFRHLYKVKIKDSVLKGRICQFVSGNEMDIDEYKTGFGYDWKEFVKDNKLLGVWFKSRRALNKFWGVDVPSLAIFNESAIEEVRYIGDFKKSIDKKSGNSHLYENLLTERLTPKEEIINRKKNRLIPEDVMKFIFQSDPKATEDMISEYGEWLILVYRMMDDTRKRFFVEDMRVKIVPALKRAIERNIPINLGTYKDFGSLLDYLEPLLEEPEAPTAREEKESGVKKYIYEDEKWLVLVPATAGCHYAKGTRWCTTDKNTFKDYMEKGNLYIVINKNEKDRKGRNKKYQIHFQEQAYMDERDVDIKHKVLPNFLWQAMAKQEREEGRTIHIDDEGKFHNENGPAVYNAGLKREQWFIHGKLHREDGPAVIRKDGAKQWHLNDKLHRIGGPAIEWPDGSKRWYVNDKLHREDGPAVIRKDGANEWWINNKKHRIGGPAVVYQSGAEEWYVNGKLHREDGPAITDEEGAKDWYINGEKYKSEDEDGAKEWYDEYGRTHREDGPAVESDVTTEWYIHGKLHREDGPAVEWDDGTKYWYIDDKPHREDGPAIMQADGKREWHLNGKEFSKGEWQKEVKKVKSRKKAKKITKKSKKLRESLLIESPYDSASEEHTDKLKNPKFLSKVRHEILARLFNGLIDFFKGDAEYCAYLQECLKDYSNSAEIIGSFLSIYSTPTSDLDVTVLLKDPILKRVSDDMDEAARTVHTFFRDKINNKTVSKNIKYTINYFFLRDQKKFDRKGVELFGDDIKQKEIRDELDKHKVDVTNYLPYDAFDKYIFNPLRKATIIIKDMITRKKIDKIDGLMKTYDIRERVGSGVWPEFDKFHSDLKLYYFSKANLLYKALAESSDLHHFIMLASRESDDRDTKLKRWLKNKNWKLSLDIEKSLDHRVRDKVYLTHKKDKK